MYFRLAKRMLLEADKRLVWKLFWNAGVKGLNSVRLHKARLKRGEFFPPFLYISAINTCNLRCQGCWVDVSAKQGRIEADAFHRMLNEAKAMGNSFFGVLGGEPFLHKELLDILEQHPDAYFQIFTNGHFIDEEAAKRMRRMGNVTPLISIEGSEIVSDTRRGKKQVYSDSMRGIENCLKHKVLTGVCTSLCQTNIDDLLRDEWVDRLIEMGVFYTWFHIYRVVGPDASPDLALTPEQQRRARQFVVDIRCRKPIIVVDAYYDADGNALCPAATGFTHHVSPWGAIEPCPVIQFAKESIHDERPLREVFNESDFLRDFRQLAATHTRGCIALERPDLLKALKDKHGAADSTARQTIDAELVATESRPSQYAPGDEIPERSWAYRIAKKIAFHDYGVYGKHFNLANWADPRKQGPMAPSVTTGTGKASGDLVQIDA